MTSSAFLMTSRNFLMISSVSSRLRASLLSSVIVVIVYFPKFIKRYPDDIKFSDLFKPPSDDINCHPKESSVIIVSWSISLNWMECHSDEMNYFPDGHKCYHSSIKSHPLDILSDDIKCLLDVLKCYSVTVNCRLDHMRCDPEFNNCDPYHIVCRPDDTNWHPEDIKRFLKATHYPDDIVLFWRYQASRG